MKTKNIVYMALSVALMVILSELSIKLPIMGYHSISIGFGIIVTFFVAIQLGPIYAAIVAGIADVIQAFLFPTGPFFIGFTLSSVLSGLIIGYTFKFFNKIFLKNRLTNISDIAQTKLSETRYKFTIFTKFNQQSDLSYCACFISILAAEIETLFLNTIWLHMLYGTPYQALVIPRIISCLIRVIIIPPIAFSLLLALTKSIKLKK